MEASLQACVADTPAAAAMLEHIIIF